MTTQPEGQRVNHESVNVVAQQIEELRRLFPAAVTEGKIDSTKLLQLLGSDVAEGGERFGLSWLGKSDAIKAIQASTTATLLPVPNESVNFDATENLVIEGDNLEVLKLLQGGYHGRVKMIYIDPPYNTGGEFIYPDNYREGLSDYLKFSGQATGEGIKLTSNAETDGRYHSKWLTMIYPRLFLARNLLREDGVIFVSIDDHEVHSLRAVMNEIFGEENFAAQLVWVGGRKNDSKQISVSHEYILCYAKSLVTLNQLGIEWRERKEGIDKIYTAYERLKREFGSDWKAISEGLQEWYRGLKPYDPAKEHEHYRWADACGVYFASDVSGPDDGRKSRPRYEVLHPRTKKPVPIPARGWRWEWPRMEKELAENRVHFGEDETSIPNIKVYLRENEFQAPSSVFYKDRRAASGVLKDLLSAKVFDFPKDHEVLKRLVLLIAKPNEIVMDFFAGSGSTAQAVLELNEQDCGNRKFILVQLPEPTEQKDYPTIADITKERVRRVIKKLNDADDGKLPAEHPPDRGFKIFKLGSSNFRVWDPASAPKDSFGLAEQLKLIAHNVEEGRPEDALLYELVLRSNLPLTSKVEAGKIGTQTFYDVADGTLAICLERKITQETLRGIMTRKPKGVICLDIAFAGNDQLKTNTVLEMKSHEIEFHTA